MEPGAGVPRAEVALVNEGVLVRFAGLSLDLSSFANLLSLSLPTFNLMIRVELSRLSSRASRPNLLADVLVSW